MTQNKIAFNVTKFPNGVHYFCRYNEGEYLSKFYITLTHKVSRNQAIESILQHNEMFNEQMILNYMKYDSAEFNCVSDIIDCLKNMFPTHLLYYYREGIFNRCL